MDDGRETGRVEGANSPGVVTEQRVKSRIEGEPSVLLIKAVRENVGEAFRADAKAQGQDVVIGGWECLGGRDSQVARWFSSG